MFWSMHNQPYVGRIALCKRKKLLKSGEIRDFYGMQFYEEIDNLHINTFTMKYFDRLLRTQIWRQD